MNTYIFLSLSPSISLSLCIRVAHPATSSHDKFHTYARTLLA